MQICRICMNSERKMHPFNGDCKKLYEQIIGTNFISQDLPQYVCWECGYYMSKYVTFRNKAMRSLRILTDILNKDGLINQTICSHYKEESTLTHSGVFTDVYVGEEENVESLEPLSEVKIETESVENNFVDEKDDLTQDLNDDYNYSDNILLTDNLNVSLPTNIIIENKDTIEENKKSPRKLSCVKKNSKKKVKDKNCVKNKNTNKRNHDSTGDRVCKIIKRASRAKGRKLKSVRDEIDEEIISVTEFTIDQQIDEVQNRKESDNYKNSPFKCEICFKGFLDTDTLERHMIKHSGSSGVFECPLCKTRYNRTNRLSVHMRTHMYKFSCRQCNFSARSLEVAKHHAEYHKGTRHTCPHCKEVFVARNSMLSHIRIKHPSDVICQHCGLSFLNEKGLNKHVKWVHRFDEKTIPEGGPRCLRCDVTFRTQEALDNHIQVSTKHADERQGRGGRNALKRTNKKAFKNQRRILYPSEPYPEGPRNCEQCDEKLPNPLEYCRHFRTVHKNKNRTVFDKKRGERHMCEVCGRLFQSAALLRSHKFVHSETKQFKCERCDKRFQLEVHLWSHRRNHCGVRNDYPCSECGRNFSSQSNRSRHMVVHTGHTYKCEWCNKEFRCPGNLKNHVDFVHKKKPWPKRNRGPRRRAEKQPETMPQNPQYGADMEEQWNTP